MSKIERIDGQFCEIVHSPDDGGWYVELINGEGKTVNVTEVCPTRWEAIQEVRELIKEARAEK